MSVPNTSPSSDPLAIDSQARWFAEAVYPHDVALRGYLRSRFPSVEAEDVVQESYYRLFKARAKGKIALSKAYIFAVARNTALTLLHRRRIFSTTALVDLPDSAVIEEQSDASDHFNDQLRFQLALEAIDGLPPRCREIFRLAALDHMSTAEIARLTGLAENTVYAQLAIGVRKCAEFLRERGERK
jgi:RNA polymerase sigma factor (sigma-70 family)